jgi:hypothetical protein
MKNAEYIVAVARARAYGEGRTPDDPTSGLPEPERSEIRGDVLLHMAKLERNRVAAVTAKKSRSGRTCDGEYVYSVTAEVPEVYVAPPATWDALVELRESRGRRS